MAHDVFISYSSKDKNVADAACAMLEARGVRCWMAPRDILPGSEWGAAIIGAIGSSKVMVLIYTSSSNASPQVRREVERAVARGLHVIPFRVEDVPMSPALEYFISTPHWLDALSPPLERHLDHLSRIIKAVLDAQGAGGPAAPAGGAFDAIGEAAANGGATAATGATGWTHGPPPGAFGQGQPAAGPPAVGTSAPPSPRPSKPAKKLVLAGAGLAATIGVGVGIYFVSKSGNEPETIAKNVDNAAAVVTGTATPPPDANAAKALPVTAVPPATPEVKKEPAPPAEPPKPSEPPASEVRKFHEFVAEGNVRATQVQSLLAAFPKLVSRKTDAGDTPLYEAAKGGHASMVAVLLEAGADPKAVSSGNNTALHGAAASGVSDADLLKSLAAGNPNPRNADGDAPIHVAANAGHADAARALAAAGADVNAADKSGRTPLQLAMGLKDATQSHAVAVALIEAGAKPDLAASAAANTPLHDAAARGDVSLLSAMIAKGAKLTRPGANGRTPLHLAVLSRKPEVVKVITGAKGAAVESADNQGNTPLHLAATLPETGIAEALLAAGAKVSTSTKERQTPLHVAAAAGNGPMVDLFMRHGGAEVLTKGKPPSPVDVAEKAGKKDVAMQLRRLEFPAMLQSAIAATTQPPPARLIEMIRKDPRLAEPTDASGRNALHQCAAAGNVAFATELVKANPGLVRALTAGEETPLHVAAQYKQAGVAKVLLGASASVRATNRNGDTPLHTAARFGATDVIMVLLDAGADPDITNRDGNRPAGVAGDAATKSLLAKAEEEAGPIRDAWSGIDLTARGFDVKAPGLSAPIRIRFRDRRTFSVEGDIGGSFKTYTGTYAKGPLTLTMESPEGALFPTVPGTTYNGKVVPTGEGAGFTWKIGGAEVRFERP